MSSHNPPSSTGSSALSRLGDPIVLLLTVGFIVAFVSLSLYDIDLVADSIGAGFAWTAATLGTYFQLLLLLTFVVAMGVAISPAASARVGNLDSPQIGT
ncbi:MAG: BCCT family transporter, partial [Pseudomonadota bacterium]